MDFDAGCFSRLHSRILISYKIYKNTNLAYLYAYLQKHILTFFLLGMATFHVQVSSPIENPSLAQPAFLKKVNTRSIQKTQTPPRLRV